MIYTGDNSMIVACNCGCDNILTVKVSDAEVYLTCASSDFSTYQRTPWQIIKENFDMLMRSICRRKYFLSSMELSQKDIGDFLRAIDEIKVLPNGDKGKNEAVVSIEKDDFEEFNIAWLCVYSKLSPIQILRNKAFRAYDIVWNKEQWDKFKEYAHRKLDEIA